MKRLAQLILTLLTSLTTHMVVAGADEFEEEKAHQDAVLQAEAPLVDPTRPNWYRLNTSKKKSKKLVLNSLVMSPLRRIAVVNGELMREGDIKGGITLQQILHDRVLIITKDGKKRVLKLNESSLRISKETTNRTNKLAQSAEGATR